MICMVLTQSVLLSKFPFCEEGNPKDLNGLVPVNMIKGFRLLLLIFALKATRVSDVGLLLNVVRFCLFEMLF